MSIETLFDHALALALPSSSFGAATVPPIVVEKLFDDSAPPAFADPVQIEQVLLNLVRNAIQAMHTAPSRNHRLTLRTTSVGRDIAVSVADTGPGIAAERRGRIFEPFYTTKSARLGLGLSISRTIVEQHGGRISVDSSTGGTIFTFTLPKAQTGDENAVRYRKASVDGAGPESTSR